MKQTAPPPSSEFSTPQPACPAASPRAKVRARYWLLGFALLSVSAVMGQGPQAAPAPAAPAAQPAPASNNKKEFSLSRDGAAFDPGSDVMTWDGNHWNVNNNRIFEAR